MDHPHTTLLETAVRPVTDNAEMRLAGIDYLNRLCEGRSGGEVEIVRRWEKSDRSNARVRCRIMLTWLLLAGSLWLALWDFEGIKRVATDGIFRISDRDPENAERRIARKLNPAQRTLIFGDLSTTDPVKRKAALWQSDPENRAYYVEYVLTLIHAEKPLPADFLATARRIDPDNAWFTYLAAALESQVSVKGKPRNRHTHPPSWEIKDRPRLERTVALLREAKRQPACETYSTRRLAERLALLPQASIQERSDSLQVLSENSRSGGFPFRQVGQAIAASAWLAGEEANATDLRQALQDGERLLRAIYEIEPGFLMEEISYEIIAQQIASNFWPACQKLGLIEDSVKWKDTEERLAERRERRRKAPFLLDGVPVAAGLKTKISDASFEMLAGYALAPPPLTDADLQPGRHADHDRVARNCCYFTFGILAALICLISSFRYRVPQLGRHLARRMDQLLMPVDWTWLGLAGILLPFLYVTAINRFTSWGGRDFGLLGSAGLLPAAQFAGLVVLWLAVSVILIRWRLAKRARLFGFSTGNLALPIMMVTCTLVYIPMVGWAAVVGTVPEWWVVNLEFPNTGIEGRPVHENPMWIAAGMLAAPLLWLLAVAGRALLSPSATLLHRATAVRVLLPVLAMAMFVMLLAAPLFKWGEEYWSGREFLMRFDPAYPSWSRYDYLLAVQARKELQEILGYGP